MNQFQFMAGCLIILCTLTSCAKNEGFNSTLSSTSQSYITTFHDCKEFADDSDAPLYTLIIACNSARFEHYTIFFEDVKDNLYTIRVKADKGFASIWIDTHQKTCVLDFFCVDDTYCYEDFLEAFMEEFTALENREAMFEELLEMWD